MASWATDQIKYATGIGFFMSFYGAIAMVVYFLPSDWGFGWKYKILIIAAVLITLPFALIIGFVVSRRNKKKKEKEEAENKGEESANEPSGKQKLSTPVSNDEITQGIEEAVQFLKTSDLSAGKEAVYALPWYIIAGTPKSGKSSLSMASGLNFQNLPSQRQSEQKFIRPTRTIDWRVTNDAVFLDTSGRYQTEGVDKEEWAGILETIKKYRPNRPIDGLILTANSERLLQADEKEIEETAKILRSRIDETTQRTKVRFPIYLVFTHADSIEGFRDSFSTSRKEGENLVWGATIPLEKSKNAHTLFDPEYDLLHNSVMKRRLMRLSSPFPAIRQIKIFNFPLHFGSGRKKLGHFVSTLFRPNPFSESPFLRGFYFTAVPVNRPQMRGDAGQTMTNVAQTVGQSFFTEKLFRDVILRDKDLVATFQAQQAKPPILGWFLTLLGAFLTFLFLAGSGYSLYQNYKFVNEATKNGKAVLEMYQQTNKGKNPLEKPVDETKVELEKIENLRRSLAELDDYDRGRFYSLTNPPFFMRFGLYSGSRLFHEQLLSKYFNAIEQRFKKPAFKHMEDDLQAFANGTQTVDPAKPTDPAKPNDQNAALERNYNLLKAYLMLSDEYRQYAEPSSLVSAFKPYWKKDSKTPTDQETIADAQLEFYAKQIDRNEFPRIKLKPTLVDAVRTKLQAFPAYLRYYNRVTDKISKDVEAVTVTTALGGTGKGIMDGTVSVPGAYTIDGYRNYMKKAILEAQVELTKDDWVMGEKAGKATAQGEDIQRLRNKYFADYADKWGEFIHGISVKTPTTPDEAANTMNVFASNNSPMATLAKRIAYETNLSAPPKTTGWIDWIFSYFQTAVDPATDNNTTVETQLGPLIKFVAEDEKKNSQLLSYGAAFNDLSNYLEKNKTQERITKLSKELADDPEKSEIGKKLTKADSAIGDIVKPFEEQSFSPAKEMAILLKKPLGNLKIYLGAKGIEQISNTYITQVLPAARGAEKGYPFDTSGSDANIGTLTAYLNPDNGTLSVFYRDSLAKYFTGTAPQLKPKEENKDMFSDEFVKYLNNAFRLRDAMFEPKSKTPKFAYTLALQKVNTQVLAVDGAIDGQPVKSDGTTTGSTALTFPSNGGDSGVILKFTSTAGDSSATPGKTTPSPSPSANSPTTPVNPTGNKFLQGGSTDIKPLTFQGTWGLFKFFDAGSHKPDGAGGYTLTYPLGNKQTLTINVKATTAGADLFDRSYFTLVKAPDKLK